MTRHEVVFAAREQHIDKAKAKLLISGRGSSLQKSRTRVIFLSEAVTISQGALAM